MRLVPTLAAEFEDACRNYSAASQQGRDMVTLVKMFGDEYDHLRSSKKPDFGAAWKKFLDEHKHQITIYPMAGLILYNLITYWDMGPMLYDGLPTLERMLLRDITGDISEEIKRRSAENGNAVSGS